MTNEEVLELFLQEFGEDSVEQVSEKLETMQEHPHFYELCDLFCNMLVSMMTDNYVKYDAIRTKSDVCQLFFKNVKFLRKDEFFYWGFYYFLQKDYRKCETALQGYFEEIEEMTEADFVYILVIPFKNAYEGFWDFVLENLKGIPTEDGIVELCTLVKQYYTCESMDEILELLQNFVRMYPKLKTPREWLGLTYYSASMWHNAIAYFESVEEPVYFTSEERFWMLAWANGKIRNLKQEEAYYRKILPLNAEREFLLNNLAYNLLRQKKYSEAESLLETCLKDHRDLPYAANNYVRLLLETGRLDKAKKLVEEGKFRISKNLRDKISKLKPSDLKKKEKTREIIEAAEHETAAAVKPIKNIKRQQFSNEKLLEDELTARIESKIPVFGLNLKMYKRKGEYGRQYIIPIGRLDLLCEDEEGNLYIIELKKDSGYDDAYKQLSDYLEWFEQSDKFKRKKIFGILCLNSPTKELLEKVHADARMKIYEYQISYTER